MLFSNFVLVGDQTTEGSFDYERFDGTTLGIPYATELDVQLDGTSGTTMELSLGTPERPNVEPLVAYYMSDDGDAAGTPVGQDALGLFHASVIQTHSEPDVIHQPERRDHYQQHAGDSLVFDGKSYLRSELPVSRFNATTLGFRIDAYVDNQSTGELFSLGDDLVALELLSGNRLQLSANGVLADTSSSSVTLDTMELATGWHTIAGIFRDGEFTLYLDGGVQWTESLASLALPTDGTQNLDLDIGRSFVGALDNLELYDPDGPALLLLSDGVTTAESLSVTVGASGSSAVSVLSTGQLNQSHASFLAQRSIELSSDQGTRDFVNMMSMDSYRDLAGAYATTLYDGAELPGIDDSALDSAMFDSAGGRLKAVAAVGDFFISPAHAGFFGLSRSSFLSGLSSLASLILPINEIKAIWLQLGYLATDPSKFEAGELVINIISLATYFPLLRPLQIVVKPLKALYRRIGNKPYTKAVGGVLGEAFERLYKTRSADALLSLVPYLLIVGEMARQPEAIDFMVEAIQSSDDLWAWVNFLTLPDGGWEGDGGPPLVAQLHTGDINGTQVGAASSVFGFLMNDAVASNGPKGKRFGGLAIATMLKNLVVRYGAWIHPRTVTDAFRILSTTLRKGEGKGLRAVVNSRSIIVGTAILGRYARARFKKYLAGNTDARISPPLFLALVAFLEKEMSSGYLETLPDADHIESKIRSAYFDAMLPVFVPILNKYEPGSSHGAMFELAGLAYYTALKEVKSYQRARWVSFYKDDGENQKLENQEKVIPADEMSILY